MPTAPATFLTWLRNIVYWHAAEKGGHFAAWEQPEIFAREVRAGIAAIG